MSSVSHYNKVAMSKPVLCGAMRAAHNDCKRQLLGRAVQLTGLRLEECNVLDLACGRGGDLNKLERCRTYVGVDNADGALIELRRRADELRMRVAVYCTDAASLEPVQSNLALCNFALHYFCDTEEHCAGLMDVISRSLVSGGTFCGTYERAHGAHGFGIPHHAVVGDCVDALEWRVPWRKVVTMAHCRGLALVWDAPFQGFHADRCIWGFIYQQVQGQCCGTTRRC